MKRALYTVLFVASAFIAISHYNSLQRETELQVTPAQVEWLNKRLAQEDKIRALEKKLNNLKARYEAIPNGAPYHTPWSSASEIKTYIYKAERDPKFKHSCRCEKVTDETRVFCRDYQRAKSDQARWHALAKLAVEINAAQHDLTIARIEAGQMGDNIPELHRQALIFMREA